MSGAANARESDVEHDSLPRVRWSSAPHRHRVLLIRGTAALVFFAFAIPGILIGLSFPPAYLLVIAGGLGLFITIFLLERRLPPASEYVSP